jgi:hypothetical protein
MINPKRTHHTPVILRLKANIRKILLATLNRPGIGIYPVAPETVAGLTMKASLLLRPILHK